MARSLQTSLVTPLLFAVALTVGGCSGADSPIFGNNGEGGGGGSAGDGGSQSAPSSTGTDASTSGVASSGTTTTANSSAQSSTTGDVTTATGTGAGGQGGGEGGAGGDSSGPGGGRCGDDSCDPDESCETCEEDCGVCKDECGDRVCQDSEDCESCPADCGACVENCREHDECDDDQVCIEGECENALGRSYVFTVVSATFSPNDPGNVAWDPVGAPDGFVDFCTSAVCPAGRTNTRQDSYTPAWNETFLHDFEDGGDAHFVLWDEDLDADDFALETPLGTANQWIDVVRNQGGTYTYQSMPGLSLTIQVEPQ